MKQTRHVALLFVAAASLAASSGLAQTSLLERTFYLPMDEDHVFATMQKIFGGVSAPLRGHTAIVPSVTNTVIYYDHVEDGFEDNLAAPTQATTQIWGDGIPGNGALPGFEATDLNVAGGAINLTNPVPIPRVHTNLLYDAGDKLRATLPVSVARILNESATGESLSGSLAVYPYEKFGFGLVAPVGTNSLGGALMFQVVDMFVMSAFNENIIRIDADADGVFEDTDIINEGESILVEGCREGARVYARYPLQGQLVCGAVGGVKQMRWLSLVPDIFWDSAYLSAVGEVKNQDFVWVFYNDNPNAITTRCETLFTTNNLVIPGRGSTNFYPADDTGIRVSSIGTNVFQMLGFQDVDGGAMEWGLGVFPVSYLTEMILASYAPGCSDYSRNSAPVWFTPATNCLVYIDYDGDPSTGPQIDPKGNHYDVAQTAKVLEIYRVYDPGADNDQTSMRIYNLGKVPLSGAWGEDHDVASAGSPHLDMGYSIFPLPILDPRKSHGLYADNDGDGLLTPGDELIYTISVTRIGFDAGDGDVVVHDDGPINATYVNNSTLLSQSTNVSDTVVPPGLTRMPLDETGLNVGYVGLGQTVVLTYRAMVPDPFPSTESGVLNCVSANGTEICYFTPVYLGGLISGKVVQDIDGDGDASDPDPGVRGVEVVLFPDADCDGSLSGEVAMDTNITGTAGGFSFNADTGCYVLVQTDLAGYFSTGDTSGDNDNKIPLVLASGANSPGNYFLDAFGGLSISKTAEPPGPWFPLQEVTYTLSLSNTGGLDQTGVWVFDDFPDGLTAKSNSLTVTGSARSTNSLRDDFNSVAYTNNNGSDSWFNNWVEAGDDGSAVASAGHIGVLSNRLYFWGNLLPGGQSITRCAELSSYASAVLSYSFGSSVANDLADSVRVQVSTNGSAWTTLHELHGNVGGITNFDLTPFISGLTYLRFAYAVELDLANEQFWFDDIRITSTELSTYQTTGSLPRLILTNCVLPAGGFMNITFTSVVGFTDSVVTNIACMASALHTDPLCAGVVTAVDTGALPFRVSGYVFNDVDGDGVSDQGEYGLPGVEIGVFTDPDGNGNPGDGLCILTNLTDGNGRFFFAGLAPGSFVLVEKDPGGFESTGDSMPPNDNCIPFTVDAADNLNTNIFRDWMIGGVAISKVNDLGGGEMDLGENVSYTIVVTNTRNATAGGVWVRDVMPSEISYEGPTRVVLHIPRVEEQVADRFGVASYTNQFDGVARWISPWVEEGDDSNPGGGDVLVANDAGSLRINLQDDANGISRGANLVGYDQCTLGFLYRHSSLETNEGVWFQIRTNSGSAWTTLDGFFPPPATHAGYVYTQYNLTAWISTSTYIGFHTPAGGMAASDDVFIDDVVFSCVAGGITTNSGSSPPALLTNYTLSAGAALVVTFPGEIGSGDSAVNRACVYTAADTSGLICASASNVISAIAMTQGLLQVDSQGIVGGVQLSWTHSTNSAGMVDREYELLYTDCGIGWRWALTNTWKSAATVFNSGCIDTGNIARVSCTNLGSRMRFYRAARRDKWRPTNQVAYASREIYFARTLQLEAGENWVSLAGCPFSNSIKMIFGTNQLPAGADLSSSTVIEWYGSSQNAAATNTVWLAQPGIWMRSSGGRADDMSVPVSEGFNIIIPTNRPASTNPVTCTFVARLPVCVTPNLHQLRLQGTGSYNLVSWNWPLRTTLAASGLREVLTGAPSGQIVNPNNSDEIRIFERGGGSQAAPKYRILKRSDGQFVYWTSVGGHPVGANAEGHFLEVDDAIVIYTRANTNSSPLWTQQIPYPVPNNNLCP